MGGKQVCLMKGHGMTAVGRTVVDSTLNTLALVELTEMMYQAYLLGDPTPILPEEIEAIKAARADTRPRTRGSSGGDAGKLALWRYYSSLAMVQLFGNVGMPSMASCTPLPKAL